MNIYILPFSEDELYDRIFSGSASQGSMIQLWKILKSELAKKKIGVHTLDIFKPSKVNLDDLLVVFNHPEESFVWRFYYFLKYRNSRGGFPWRKRRLFYDSHKYFRKKILLQLEPPVPASTTYRILPKLSRLYSDIYLIAKNFKDRSGNKFKDTNFIYDSYDRDEAMNKYFDAPKEKFLTMINANSAPHTLYRELYGQRLKAIKYFSRFSDFDLYGQRWDARPKHPFWWFRGGFIKKVWRGVIGDKWEILSRYKFALVFENCVYPGYVSEKIFDCFVTGAVPIYLGAPDIEKYVPGDCFIDARNLRSYKEMNNFLRSLTAKDISAYRSAAADFLKSGKDRPFTSSFFIERFLEIVSPGVIRFTKDSKAPLVSVVVPTYNISHYLIGAIKSVLAQTYENWELIIIDDGSIDDTRAVVQAFPDKRIRYFHQENKGLAATRNRGMAQARGKYIAFLDADDIFLPKKLEKHVAYLENHPECDFSYDEILFFRDEKPGKFYKVMINHLSGFLKEEFIRIAGHCIGPSSAFFRRELFQKYGGEPEKWRNINEDYYFWLKLAMNKVYFQHLADPLTLSRLRPQSISRSASYMKEAAELNLEIFRWLNDALTENDPARRYLPDFLSVRQRRLALGHLILKNKKDGLCELKKWRYGRFLTPILRILPSNLISFLLTSLISFREQFLFKKYPAVSKIKEFNLGASADF